MSTSLTQLITDEHVVLGARPQSRQDAILLAAAPLVASASVTDHYIDRMIEVSGRADALGLTSIRWTHSSTDPEIHFWLHTSTFRDALLA